MFKVSNGIALYFIASRDENIFVMTISSLMQKIISLKFQFIC